MRIGRAFIVPAVLALSVAGSVVSGPAITVAAAVTPATHVSTFTIVSGTGVYHHD